MHTIVFDLTLGDAGKGKVVDSLSARGDVAAVVRFNGGAQAAHNVVLEDGRHHTFAQFGSGTLRGVPTHLSRYVMVNPLNLEREAAHLEELGVSTPYTLLTVDEDAPLITWYHVYANRNDRNAILHGSCGQGIGVCARYALENPLVAPRVRDLHDRQLLVMKLEQLRIDLNLQLRFFSPSKVADELIQASQRLQVVDGTYLKSELLSRGRLLFEGAQGVLLDEHVGFHPHTTWSTTTPTNALQLLSEAGVSRSDVATLGLTRAYATRHGAGPLVSEDPTLASLLLEPYNVRGTYQGEWRVGHPDFVTLRYAADACGPDLDELGITHLDTYEQAHSALRLVDAYVSSRGAEYRNIPQSDREGRTWLGVRESMTKQLSASTWIGRPAPTSAREFADEVEQHLKRPLTLISYGPMAQQTKMRKLGARV